MLLRLVLGFVLLGAGAGHAAITGHEILDRSDVLEGRAFGSVGPYERLAMKYRFAIDPQAPANRIIADIDFAPRNDQGLVEFSADVYVLKPTDPARGNGTLLFEVSNRGRKGMLSTFMFAEGSLDPRQESHFGDFSLLEQGYTLLWVGWQFDVPRRPELMRVYPPVARHGNKPILGLVRSEFTADKSGRAFYLGDRDMIAYRVADPADPKMQLTVRSTVTGERTVVPRDRWQLAREESGKPVPDPTWVYLPGGYEAGKIYELVYQAQDPVVVGLGPAAVREVISFLKYNTPNRGLLPLGDISMRSQIKRAIAVGSSQSGRFLRTFLYYGFNADVENRQVFDGIIVHVAGGGRGSFNHRFAQPSRDGHPFMNNLYPTDIYPYSDIEQLDPETGLNQGILSRAKAAGVVPKIFYTNSSCEYWGRTASLIHTTLDGKEDAPLPDTTRIYFLTGSQHGAGNFPPNRGNYVNPSNTNDYRYAMRGLLAAMNAWLTDGTEPPPSRYPRIDNGTLVALDQLKFPKLPGIEVPRKPKGAWRVDYGPQFLTSGLVRLGAERAGRQWWRPMSMTRAACALKGSLRRRPRGLLRRPFSGSTSRRRRNMAHATAMAEAAQEGRPRARDLVDPGRHAPSGCPLSDDRMPTLMGKYKVPHYDAKGEARCQIFTTWACPRRFSTPRSTGTTSFTSAWGRRKGRTVTGHDAADGRQNCRASPPRISASAPTGSSSAVRRVHRQDRGHRRRAPHRRPDGRGLDPRPGPAGDLQRHRRRSTAASVSRAPRIWATCFSSSAISTISLRRPRSRLSRSLNPALQTFEGWLRENKDRIPIE
jgi:hypothetical protein